MAGTAFVKHPRSPPVNHNNNNNTATIAIAYAFATAASTPPNTSETNASTNNNTTARAASSFSSSYSSSFSAPPPPLQQPSDKPETGTAGAANTRSSSVPSSSICPQIPVRHGPAIPTTTTNITTTAMKPDTALGLKTTGNPPSKKSDLAIRTFSPVNANGCFECDRVLKAGNVLKRTRKTKSWKPIHLVLRPQTLSLYADKEGTRLRHQIQLSDITAVARQRDPRKKERHVFALFSPERNYHIEAPSELEAQRWVEQIRTQARIDEEEDEIIALMSPVLERPPGFGDGGGGFFGRSTSTATSATKRTTSNTHASSAVAETSASEIEATPPIHIKKSRSRSHGVDGMHSAARASSSSRKPSAGPSHLSGAEQASYSDFSDAGGSAAPAVQYPDSSLSLPQLRTQAEKDERARKVDEIYRPSAIAAAVQQQLDDAHRPRVQRSASGLSARNFAGAPADAERVVYNGYLYLLRSKGGMRQWKSVWAVLRAKSLALYKNDDEYQPLHIIPFAAILEALDIDNVSRSKRHCFQVITEERQFKFCARSEEELVKWVGGFKALLAKRREVERTKDEAGPVPPPSAASGGAVAAAPVR